MVFKLRDWIKVEKLDWKKLSSNPNAIQLLEANPDKICWSKLSKNPNPNALKLLQANPEKIDWWNLSFNPNLDAIELLKKNQNKICWSHLSSNPSIFTYDYEGIKNKNKDLNFEIIHKALHPKRMLRLMEEYGEDEIYDCFFNDD